ncbi:MAG: hypothetical protein ACYC0Q_10090 [Eubacteriales bacterium]
MGATGKLTPSQPGDRPFNEQGGQNLDEVALSISAGRVPLKEVLIKDLPLYLVFTSLVFASGLPKKEFLSSEEFEGYLTRYAGEKFEKPGDREKFIKRQKNNAVIVVDEIYGDTAWQIEEENFDYARLCGFGVLKSEAKLFYMFQTILVKDLPSQMAAYQALAYGRVDHGLLPLFATRKKRERLKELIGESVYSQVLKAIKG